MSKNRYIPVALGGLIAFVLTCNAFAHGEGEPLRWHWPNLFGGMTEHFEFKPACGVRVRGCVQGTYLRRGCDLVGLSVEVENPPAGEPVRLVAPRREVAKLVSELPAGWRAICRGKETEIVIPADRPRRAYPDEAILPRPKDVPELMIAEDGRRISTREEWETIRRPEILGYFREQVYGKRPCERPQHLEFEQLGNDRVMMDGAAIRKIVRVTYGGAHGTNSFPFTVFIPTKRKGPAPSFVLICNRDRSNIDPERKVRSEFWPAERIVARGFAAIAFYNGDVTPDYVHGNTVGAFTCFGDVTREYRPNDEWGQLSCWGWAASRVLDWIETEPTLDAKRVAVVGHSRGGKTALWAAAEDRRFAMACVNDSGCCGMKLHHIDLPASEAIVHTICGRQDWYCLNFTRHANLEREMPYDAHCVAALIAPRKLCVASASEDTEAGPLGEFWSAYLASPAWELYGKRGLVSPPRFPAIESPLHEGSVGYHIRRGEHNLKLYDWERYMDFAEAEDLK